MTTRSSSTIGRGGAVSFFATFWQSGPPTRLSTYTIANGLIYIATGALLFAWPGAAQTLFMADPFEAQESGFTRVIGFTVVVIGYFYVMGGRTRADSFGLATVVDRLLVPIFLVPLGVSGAVDLALVLPFAILDPVLGIGAFIVWKRQGATGA